jgi:purine nucleosidase
MDRSPVPDRVPILFDTDIGSDIDDAVALEYLLRQPRCELVGVTTVTGDVAKRAALVQMLCEAAGRTDIPIHAGAPDLLLHGPGQPGVPQYEAVKDLPHRKDWPPNTAIEFMRRTVRERPGEVTLLSVGPLTNVALLFATDPEVAPLLRSWISMAGVFTDGPQVAREWNCACDPLAIAIAFRAAVPSHVHAGLDVTLKCRRYATEVRSMLQGPVQSLVLRMAEVWFEGKQEIVFHDPLAAVLPFRPDICSYERGSVGVDPASGAPAFTPNAGGRDLVAMEVDMDAFFDEYMNPSS